MKKTITILAVLAFLTLSKNAMAQCFDYNWSNTSDCDWQVDFWDNSTPPVAIAAASFTATAGGSGVYPGLCGIGCGTTVQTITFVNTNGCVVSFSLSSTGVFSQTGITSYCGAACGGAFTTETITISISNTTTGLCPLPFGNKLISITITP